MKIGTKLAIAGILCLVLVAGALGANRLVGEKSVKVNLFAPSEGEISGVSNIAMIVDMEVKFKGFDLAETGFTTPELSGPGAHANLPPFPAPTNPGKNEKFPGLIVLLSGTTSTKPFSGPGTNLAGLFNIVTVSNRQILNNGLPETELWATWIVGANKFGSGPSKILVAIAADKNGDGIFNDAPNVVPDSDNDGTIDAKDLEAFGVASKIIEVNFTINPNP